MFRDECVDLTEPGARSEKGAVLLFLAIALIAVLSVAALAIDMTLYSNARNQGVNYARLAALAAVEEYFDKKQREPTAGELSWKQSAARRANDISKTNYFFAIDSVVQHIRPNELALRDDANPPSTDVILEGGHWIYEEDATYSCESGDTPPCFVPETDNTKAINAMRVTGILYRPVSTFLAHAAFGIQSLPPVTIDVTAAAVPRHGCFAVDISPSITSVTHHQTDESVLDADLNDSSPSGTANKINPGTGYGSYLGYYLPADNPTVNPASDLGKTMTQFHKTDWDMLYWNVLTHHGYPGTIPDPHSYFTSPQQDTHHFKEDYVLLRQYGDDQYNSALHDNLHPNPWTDPDYAIGPTGLWGRFDSRHVNQPAGTYHGAEPLRSVFESIAHTIDRFEDRAVAGDEICFVFYDQSQKWTRVVKLTDNYDYLRKLTDFEGLPTGNAALSADLPPPVGQPSRDPSWEPPAPTENSPKGFERLVRYNLVPSPGGFTNMTGGLSEALKQLEAGKDGQILTSDFIVLIGDGLTNCTSSRSPACSDDYLYHKQSLAELQNVVINQVIPAHVPLHVILVGDHVQPQTVAIAKEDGGTCLTDAEARKANLPYVLDQWFGAPVSGAGAEQAQADAYTNRSAATPYWKINYDLYEIAAATGGTWGPIRPPSPACITPNVPISNPTTCNHTTSLLHRVVYDEKCRPRGDQMTHIIDEILGTNPYVVVQVK